MSQSESDYSSSSEGDDDYIPSGEDESGDELEGVVEEEGLEKLSEQTKTKQKGTESSTRRRRGWAALEGVGAKEEDDEEAGSIQNELEEAKKEEQRRKKEESEKKKADDLWSSFLGDVKEKSKPKSSTSQKGQTSNVTQSFKEKTLPAKNLATSSSKSNGSKSNETMKITTIFDFAGEEVKITKEVASSSKEAKNYLKQQEELEKKATTVPVAGSSSSLLRPGANAASLLSTASKPAAPPGLKRPGGGLGNVLGQIGKKQKISTLEKTRLDWEGFKSAEGISEELKIHNKGKDGFVEKQKFLQRADVRQYEIERELRMAKSKINR